MDPRRRPPPPPSAKRGPSRSPEGAAFRKVGKPNPPNGSSTKASSNDGSRRSSLHAGNGPSTKMTPPMTDDNRILSRGLTNNTFSVNSSDSIGSKRSVHDDAQSGRSTPLSANGSLRTATTPQPPPPPPPGNPTNDSSNPVVNVLMDFSKQVSYMARLDLSKGQAEAEVKRANLEYSTMRKWFPSLPQLKEQKTEAKRSAEQKLKDLQGVVDEQVIVNRQHVEAIAAMIGQSAEVEPAKSRVTQNTESSVALLEEVAQLRATVVELKKGNEAMQLYCTDLDKRFRHRSQNLDNQCQNTNLACERVSADTADLKAKVASIEGSIPEIEGKVSIIADATSALSKVPPPDCESMKESVVKVEADHAALAKNVEFLLRRLEFFEAFVIGGNIEQPKHVINESSPIRVKVNFLLAEMRKMKKDVGELSQATHEDGEEPIAKRVKELGVLVNDIAARIQSDHKISVDQRMNQLETSVAALQTDAQAVRSTLASLPAGGSVPAQSVGDAARFNAFERRMEDHVATSIRTEIERQMEEKDEALIKHICDGMDQSTEELRVATENRLQEIAGNIPNIAAVNASFTNIDGRLTTLTGQLTTLKTSVDSLDISFAEKIKKTDELIDALRTSLQGKAEKQAVARVEEVMDELKTVRTAVARLDKAHTQTPDPPRSSVPPPSPRSTGSALQNGNVNVLSSMPIGTHTPKTAPPQSSGIADAPASHPTCVRRMDQLDMKFTYATRHLQQQYDNLTTDEVCTAMLHQLGAVWPHAANFATSVNELRRSLSTLSASKGSTDQRSNATLQLIRQQLDTVGRLADAAKNEAREANGAVKVLREEGESAMLPLKTSFKVLEGRVLDVCAKVASVEKDLKIGGQAGGGGGGAMAF
ncbi:hypothetical protein BAUCODRAFT_470001 [Baudoinia panamericana UAMH 10762]|uniref:Uncharacterized protein n=1 Tax=Baudoinia panamericana (strain UAMH 10762) TaxID=717646 RepID=M2NBL6_BAUPA|nr:uncharacterized protein BAUCODRAFT_470001 [Baudoinia panamericana UAMH 10762]EMC96300.1 hypothetical protein BAUCODRAFT_470001 [Baudoinia panamericana UAMH 10762]